MSVRKTVSLVFVGSELTKGIIQDTHGRYMASVLTEDGFKINRIMILPDDPSIDKDIGNEIGRSDVLIITGGLGPTSDDITREIIAGVSGGKLLFDSGLWDEISKRFTGGSGKSGGSRKRQAYVPEGFDPIPNTAGTAPGLKGKIGSTVVYVLPGPPREMRLMFDSAVLPELRELSGVLRQEVLEASCFLICESGLEEACADNASEGVTWGTRAQEDKISLYIKGGSAEARTGLLKSLKDRFGDELIKEGNVDPAVSVSELLHAGGLTLSCAESLTGGFFSKRLTDIPGSSKIFYGGMVTYTDSVKSSYLGIDAGLIASAGAVSEDVAVSMAGSIRRRTGTDYGISFTGAAGPESVSDKVPVGTVWIGLSGPSFGERAFLFRFTGTRKRIRIKAVTAGFLLMEMSLNKGDSLDSQRMWQYS